MMTFPKYAKIKNGNQTTKQIDSLDDKMIVFGVSENGDQPQSLWLSPDNG